MSIVDTFSQMSSHMIEGMMVHEQLMNSYLFLGLKGYATCHEYHYLSETDGYIRLCKYAADHLDILLPDTGRPSDPEILPKSWKGSSRSSIVANMRREAMEAALKEWLKWETDTVALYSKFYRELLDENQIPASEFVKSYILDAESEIVYARNELLHKHSMNFDIVPILEEQSEFEKVFRKKIRKLGDEKHENE